jgi:DNA-binding MarR family transcriptional regulator
VDVLLERLCELREAAETRPPVRSDADLAPEREVEELGATLAFMKELWALEQGLNRHSRAMLRRHGVTGPQRMAVRVVGRLTPVSPARLARVLHLHPSSVTRLIRRLEARDLIRRAPDPAHRGRLQLEVGPGGRRIERIEVGTAEGIVRAALRQASQRDVEATRRVLAQITDLLAPGAGEETA